jgi:hypothetical protein
MSLKARTNCILGIIVTACTLVSSSFFAQERVEDAPAESAKTIKISLLRTNTANPRYFVDDRGEPVFLTGSHTRQNLQDIAPNTSPMDFDAYLDALADHGHNFVRLWNLDLNRFNGNDAWFAVSPLPFSRPGPGTAFDGGPKFDLSSLNRDYFDRLRARCIAAGNRGFYVSILLFDGFFLHPNGGGPLYWPDSYYNGNNNINSTTTKLSNVYTLEDETLVKLMDDYVRKVIDTVNDLDNIMYEVSNETYATSAEWQSHVVDLIHGYEGTKDKQHLVGMTAIIHSDESYNSYLYSSSADWVSPLGSLSYLDNMPIAAVSKPSILDDDHVDGGSRNAAWFWKAFTRGHNPIRMDGWGSYDRVGDEAVRLAMGRARDFAARMDLLNATPTSDSNDCSTTYCLKQPGVEYLAYQPGSGAFKLAVQAGTYNYEWMNPGTGIVTKGSVTVSTERHAFTPPFSGPAVLYLWVGTRAADAFDYFIPITIDHTQVGADLTDFPVPISITDARLKSVKYGGFVRSDRGYDICFYNEGRTTRLSWEVEHYDPLTGELVAWVKMALSRNVDVRIYLAFGNPALTSLQSLPTAVWDSHYRIVHNFGPSGFLRDSTGRNSSSSSNVMPTAGGVARFNGVNSYIDNSTLSWGSGGPITVTMRLKSVSAGPNGRIAFNLGKSMDPNNWSVAGAPARDNYLYWDYGGFVANNGRISTDFAPYLDSWIDLTLVSQGNGGNFQAIYIDGVPVSSSTLSNGPDVPFSGLIIGNLHTSIHHPVLGDIKKFQLSDIVRSPEWIATEHASALPGFYTVGPGMD